MCCSRCVQVCVGVGGVVLCWCVCVCVCDLLIFLQERFVYHENTSTHAQQGTGPRVALGPPFGEIEIGSWFLTIRQPTRNRSLGYGWLVKHTDPPRLRQPSRAVLRPCLPPNTNPALTPGRQSHRTLAFTLHSIVVGSSSTLGEAERDRCNTKARAKILKPLPMLRGPIGMS